MKSFTVLKNLFTSLTANTSTTNAALGGQLINDVHRYLIQKYFDNERTSQTTTVGAQSLTTTATLASGAISGTLTAVWAYPSCSQLVNFSNSNQRTVNFTYNSTAITWAIPLSASATTAITTVGVQEYSIPANISKVKDFTVSVGQLKYTPVEIKTRVEWDQVNFLPYTSDIPNYYFIYNGKMNIFPIPSTTGNIITFNYKTRVADLTYADYSTGTINTAGMVAGSTAVTGLATNWITTGTFPSAVDLSYVNLFIQATPPNGDGIWYWINNFSSGTALTLNNPVINAPNITNTTAYTIGQMPLLSEDFHDMLVYGALRVYYSSIMKDEEKYKNFDSLYQERLMLLSDYAGTKAVNVDLGTAPNMVNPNLFLYAQS